MTKYLDDSFSVHPGANKAYRDNYDAIFGKKDKGIVDDEHKEQLPAIPAPIDMKPEPVKKKKMAAKNRRKKKAKKND